jgi:hypothetical protein
LRLVDRRDLLRLPCRHACIGSEPRPSTTTLDSRYRLSIPGLQHVRCRACRLWPCLFTMINIGRRFPERSSCTRCLRCTRANWPNHWRPFRPAELVDEDSLYGARALSTCDAPTSQLSRPGSAFHRLVPPAFLQAGAWSAANVQRRHWALPPSATLDISSRPQVSARPNPFAGYSPAVASHMPPIGFCNWSAPRTHLLLSQTPIAH